MRGKKDSGNMKKEGREQAEGKIRERKGKKRKKDIVKKKWGEKVQFKGIVSRDGYFFNAYNKQIGYFLYNILFHS